VAEAMIKADYVWALNEWWRRYRDEPERFEREWQAIMELEAAESEGRDPTMGEEGWKYMQALLTERAAV
jgi:hypothetical protein